MVSLTALVAIILQHNQAGAGGANYANCNTVNFGPACFATYNNHHLRIWNPDGSRPNFTDRQKSDLWETLLNIHVGGSSNTADQSWSHKIDRNDVFHDFKFIVDSNPFLRKILQDWQPVETEFCLKKHSAALDYIRAILAQEGITENTQRLSASRFLLSEPSGYCLNKGNPKSNYDRISEATLAEQVVEILGPDPSTYADRFADLSSWLNYLGAALRYHDRSYFFNPTESGDLILEFEKIAKENNQGWIGEAAYFTSLQLRFEFIQGELNQDPFYDLPLWRQKYEEFLLLYPRSGYKLTLQEYASGLDFYDGKKERHFRHQVDLINSGLSKLLNQEPISKFESEALSAFPRYLDDRTFSEIKTTDHPLIWDFSILIAGPDVEKTISLCSSERSGGSIGNEVCEQVRVGEEILTPATELSPEAKIARIQHLTMSREYSEALGLLDGLGKDNEAAVILALGHMFSSANLSNDLDAYIQALITFAADRRDEELLEFLVNYQLATYSEFLMSVEGLQRLLASSLPPKMLFAVLMPHIEQAILYGEYNEALILFGALGVPSEKADNEYINNGMASRQKSLLHAINALGQDGPTRDYAVGSFIYLFGVIPSCLARAPMPLKTHEINTCGFMSLDGSKVKIVKKARSDLGQIPLRLFRSAQEKLSRSQLPEDLEIKILNRLIYCFKGSQRRFSCTRKDLVDKTEVRSWFSRLNKGEKRQKYWYFDEIYFEPDAWPNYYNSLVGEPVFRGFGPSESYYLVERDIQ